MPESNSASWVIVHLISQYRDFLRLCENDEIVARIDEFVASTQEDISRIPFSRIFSLLGDIQVSFREEIVKLENSNELDTGIPAGENMSWRDLIHRALNHEIYHCGQLAYIAKILQQKANKEQ